MSDKTRKLILDAIRNELPEYFKIPEQSLLSPKTIYNLLSQGRGPDVVKINNQNYLERNSFMSWVDNRGGLKRGRKRISI